MRPPGTDRIRTTAAPSVSSIPDDGATDTTRPTTTTTAASVTSSTEGSSTTAAGAEVVVTLDGDAAAAPQDFVDAVTALYAWLSDPAGVEQPDLPEGLAEHLADIEPAGDLLIRGGWATAELPNGDSVGVADLGSDVILLVSDGNGWRVVGTKLTRFDSDPWYGDPVRRVLLVGTDARPGQDQ